MLIKKLEVGKMANFCYILGCGKTGQGAVIDPGADGDLILDEIKKHGVKLKYILATHFHYDHTDMIPFLKRETGARTVMHKKDVSYYKNDIDIAVQDGDILEAGVQVSLTVLHTPGHTPGGVCYYGEGMLFTGDTLFVGDSGRTDFPYGHRTTLGASIRRIMKLPEETIVMPGHDYGRTQTSTLLQEKRDNINAREYGFYKK